MTLESRHLTGQHPVLMLLPDPSQAEALRQAIVALLPDVSPVAYSRELPPALLAEVSAVLAWRLPSGLARRLPALRWICATGAGVDKVLVPDLSPEVLVSRVVDPEQAIGMAQFVVLMALRQARGLARYEAQQQQGQWRRHPMVAARQRVLVLGRGEVGRAVAGAMQSMGFSVTNWHTQAGPLRAALAQADMLVNTLPLTPSTEALLDARAFAAMPPGAYLINVARGGHVVEADLIAAVRSGHLAGAALDVQQQEPMAVDDPLWSVPGISITPHIAAQPAWRTVAEQFSAGWRNLQAGTLPPNLVDRTRGY